MSKPARDHDNTADASDGSGASIRREGTVVYLSFDERFALCTTVVEGKRWRERRRVFSAMSVRRCKSVVPWQPKPQRGLLRRRGGFSADTRARDDNATRRYDPYL